MPDCHDIACHTCEEFMGTFKVTLPCCEPDILGVKRSTRVAAAAVTASLECDARSFTERGSDHWFFTLRPFLDAFVERHRHHELHFYREGSGPWQPEESGYLEWKEIASAVFAQSSEHYLPRNLIDDLHITAWSDALQLLKDNTVMLIEDTGLDEYRAKFESLLRERSA